MQNAHKLILTAGEFLKTRTEWRNWTELTVRHGLVLDELTNG